MTEDEEHTIAPSHLPLFQLHLNSQPSTPHNPSTLPPELLEHILLHLSQKDLLLSQRVCTAFRRTVLGSQRLQKALFLAPDWSPSHSRLYTDGLGTEIRKPENNRLLLRAFPGCYPTVTLVIVNDAVDKQQHPLFALPPTNSSAAADKSGMAAEHWSWDVCISFPSDAPPATHPSVLYPEASWRRMFLSQPPCTSLHLVRRWQRSLKPAIVRGKGIRMGEFVEEAGRSGASGGRRDSGVVTDGEEGSGGVRDGWSERYISSDRDWHFEGNIRYDDFSARRDKAEEGGDAVAIGTAEQQKKAAEAFAARFQGYLFSRRSRNGVASAMGDEWDPGRAYEFGRVNAGGSA